MRLIAKAILFLDEFVSAYTGRVKYNEWAKYLTRDEWALYVVNLGHRKTISEM